MLHYQIGTGTDVDLPSDIISVNCQGERYDTLDSFQQASMREMYDKVLYKEEKTVIEGRLGITEQPTHPSSTLVTEGLGPFGALYASQTLPFSLIGIANQLIEQSNPGPSF